MIPWPLNPQTVGKILTGSSRKKPDRREMKAGKYEKDFEEDSYIIQGDLHLSYGHRRLAQTSILPQRNLCRLGFELELLKVLVKVVNKGLIENRIQGAPLHSRLLFRGLLWIREEVNFHVQVKVFVSCYS